MEDVNVRRVRSSQNQEKRAVVKMENGHFTRTAFENLDVVLDFVLFAVPSQDWPFAQSTYEQISRNDVTPR